MNSIAVLMSTYNGEKYLCEQLDSIFAQKNVKLHLFVRDDGSTDLTPDILTQYSKRYSNMTVDFAENIGVGNSFMTLLYSVPGEFDFYSFADQDDIWEEDKLYSAQQLLMETKNNLYVSNQECVDQDGNTLGFRWLKNDERVYLTPIGIINKNVLCGCTMVFHNNFYKYIVDEKRRPSSEIVNIKNHDGWIAIIASLMNGIVYDNRSFIKYRQHSNNVVGIRKANRFQKWKMRFKKIFCKSQRCPRSKISREILLKYPDIATNVELIKVFANANSLKGKKELLKHEDEIRRYLGEGKLMFKLKVLLGFF